MPQEVVEFIVGVGSGAVADGSTEHAHGADIFCKLVNAGFGKGIQNLGIMDGGSDGPAAEGAACSNEVDEDVSRACIVTVAMGSCKYSQRLGASCAMCICVDSPGTAWITAVVARCSE